MVVTLCTDSAAAATTTKATITLGSVSSLNTRQMFCLESLLRHFFSAKTVGSGEELRVGGAVLYRRQKVLGVVLVLFVYFE